MKLSSKIHGIIDYLLIVFLLIAPTIFKLPEVTALYTYLLAGVHLAITVCTNYEYGLVRFIPLKIHGYVEVFISIILVAIAFYLANVDGVASRNFYFGLAVTIFLIWILSDYTNRPKGTREIPYVESNTDGDMI